MNWIIKFSLLPFLQIWEGGKSGFLFAHLQEEKQGFFISAMEAFISKAGGHIATGFIIHARY